MKRISRLMGLTLVSLLLIGGSHSFANQPNKPKPLGPTIKQDIGFIEQLLDDIFGGSKTPNNNPTPSSGGGNWTTGPTAPIDGGISLLLAAGIGLGVKKMADRNKVRRQKSTEDSE
jgi:hypothetical protein